MQVVWDPYVLKKRHDLDSQSDPIREWSRKIYVFPFPQCFPPPYAGGGDILVQKKPE